MCAHLELTIDQINEELLALMAVLNDGEYINPNAESREVLEHLANVNESIGAIKEKVVMYSDFQRLFQVRSFCQGTPPAAPRTMAGVLQGPILHPWGVGKQCLVYKCTEDI